MDYNTLEKLDQGEIREGLKTYFNTAKDLLESGEILAEKGKYGPASAMTVLSLEELIKGFATLLFFLGDRSKENIESAFKGTMDTKSIHQARLKYASGLNFILSKVNVEAIIEKLGDRLQEVDLNPKGEILTREGRIQYYEDISGKIAPLISPAEIGLTDENLNAIEDNLQDSSNWFLHAKTLKEKGLYGDFINSSWHSPSDITKEKYEEANKYARQMFEMVGTMLEGVTATNNDAYTFLRVFLGKFKELPN
jgi:AbiV family abortive infection protein